MRYRGWPRQISTVLVAVVSLACSITAAPAAAVEPGLPVPRQTSDPNQLLELVGRQADHHIQTGLDLAARGATFAAEAELIKALEMIGYAHDGLTKTAFHHNAIVAGLTALAEVDDFALTSAALATGWDLANTISAHRTPVLKDYPSDALTPILATSRYCTFAQRNLVEGCGRVPAGSRALCGLARIEMARSQTSADSKSIGAPKAMIIFETALRVDPRNSQAANELGVLLAGYGQYEKARDVLLQSVRVCPTAAAWYNLSVVSRELGDEEQAKFASQQHEQALAQRDGDGEWPANSSVNYPNIRWVNLDSFLVQSPPDHTLSTVPNHDRRLTEVPPKETMNLQPGQGVPGAGQVQETPGPTGLRTIQDKMKAFFR